LREARNAAEAVKGTVNNPSRSLIPVAASPIAVRVGTIRPEHAEIATSVERVKAAVLRVDRVGSAGAYSLVRGAVREERAASASGR
jgi:hypothetical protein